MKPHLTTDRSNRYVLSLPAGDVDGIAAARGLEADGYFWEGVARQLVATRRPALATRFTFDSDAATFAAESGDRQPLAELAALLTEVIDDPEQLRRLVAVSSDAEFLD